MAARGDAPTGTTTVIGGASVAASGAGAGAGAGAGSGSDEITAGARDDAACVTMPVAVIGGTEAGLEHCYVAARLPVAAFTSWHDAAALQPGDTATAPATVARLQLAPFDTVWLACATGTARLSQSHPARQVALLATPPLTAACNLAGEVSAGVRVPLLAQLPHRRMTNRAVHRSVCKHGYFRCYGFTATPHQCE